jgi:nucleotide-binding universal stress UspA family protein
MFKHILIPTDGSALSDIAVEKGVALARATGARVTFMIAVEPFHLLTANVAQIEETRASYDAHAEQHAKEILARCEKTAQAAGVDSHVLQLQHDQPHDAIIKTAASRGCDLIAMSSHGRRGLAAAFLGSQTTRVLAHSDIPVLVFR